MTTPMEAGRDVLREALDAAEVTEIVDEALLGVSVASALGDARLLAITERVVAAVEAARWQLRPMGELQPGTRVLIYGKGEDNVFVGKRRGDLIYDGADSFPANNPHFHGWTPLPTTGEV